MFRLVKVIENCRTLSLKTQKNSKLIFFRVIGLCLWYCWKVLNVEDFMEMISYYLHLRATPPVHSKANFRWRKVKTC